MHRGITALGRFMLHRAAQCPGDGPALGLHLGLVRRSCSGARITAVSEETGFRRVAQSGANGVYQLAYLRPGKYKVTVRSAGFRTLIQFGLKLDAAQSARVDFHLQLGSVEEVITVTDTPVLFNAEDASLSTLVGRNWIEYLPLDGRGLTTLLELAPGSILTPAASGEAGQFSMNGQRPNTNYFTVDGVSANTGVNGGGLPAQMPGGSLPNMTAFGSFHDLVSVEALDEFREQTSTATPEFGRSPGAQVELSSLAGSNEFHGLLFDAARNEALDANDWFANPPGIRGFHCDSRISAALSVVRSAATAPSSSFRTKGCGCRQPYTWQTTVPSHGGSADRAAGNSAGAQRISDTQWTGSWRRHRCMDRDQLATVPIRRWKRKDRSRAVQPLPLIWPLCRHAIVDRIRLFPNQCRPDRFEVADRRFECDSGSLRDQ